MGPLGGKRWACWEDCAMRNRKGMAHEHMAEALGKDWMKDEC